MFIAAKPTFLKKAALAVLCLACAFPALAAEGTAVNEESARQTALQQLPDSIVIKSKTIRRGRGDLRYLYIIVNDDARAKVVVDGNDGSIISTVKTPNIEGKYYGVTRKDGGNDGRITFEEARKIALDRTGGGEIVEIEKDYDDGMPIYEVEIIDNDNEYDVEIDAHTGDIIEYKVKSHDRRWTKRDRDW